MTDLKAAIEIELIDEVSAKARSISSSMDLVEASAVDAGRSGANAVDTFDRSLDQANASARQLSQNSGALAQAQNRAGAASSAAGSALGGNLAGGAEIASRGLLNVTQAQKNQGREMAGSLNLVSELALGFGNLSPATRGLGIAFASAGNNAFALGGALGPMGVLIGTLIGIVPALIGIISGLGDEMEATATKTDLAKSSLDEFESVFNRQTAEQARAQRIELGVETVDDAGARLAQARSAANDANARFRQAESSLDEDQRPALRSLIGQTPEQAAARIERNPAAFGLSVTDSSFSNRVERLSGAVGGVTNARRVLEDRQARLEAARADDNEATLDETFFADDEEAARRRRRARGVRSEDTIRRAVTASPTSERSRPIEGTIDIRVNGESRGRLPVAEGSSSRATFEAEAAGPEG